MEFPRYSKSRDATIAMCSWRADQIYNHGVKEQWNPAAAKGSEVHALRRLCAAGIESLDECLRLATSDAVAESFRQAIVNDPYWGIRDQFDHEITVCLNAKGQRIESRSKAYAIMILDRLGPVDEIVLVEDLKGGQMMRDSPSERRAYVCAARRVYPEHDHFRFDYFHHEIDKRVSWHYHYQKKNRVIVEGPNGEHEVITVPRKEPLFAGIQARVEEIRALEPTPTPGSHCQNMYGQPCQFLGTTCPLGQDLVERLSAEPITNPTVAEIVAMPQQEAAGMAAIALLRGWVIEEEITAEFASLALQGQMQLESGASNIKRILTRYSRKAGHITVGSTRYGYRRGDGVTFDTTKLAALRMLHSAGGLQAVADGVSVTSSSLKRLGKRKYNDLRERITDICGVQGGGKETWGELKKT